MERPGELGLYACFNELLAKLRPHQSTDDAVLAIEDSADQAAQ